MRKEVRKLSRQQTSVTVSQLNRYVATLLEKNQALNNILVKGELSNVKRYASGHWYFNIKDENAQVACVMFKGHATKLAFQPRDGQEVLVGAKVSLYEPNGKYQLNVFSMDEVGKGNLFLAYEQRKEKLRKAGYFDEGRKKELPIMPKVIGVVTSSSGAVIRDIVNVSNRRFPSTKIILYPAKVQGPGSAESIVLGIEYFNRREDIDVLIVGRGGGSIEDLWSFNEENVARAAFESSIPIISAVGHESDFTILDFVADKRAPTPSAAAEIAVPNSQTLVKRIQSHEETMVRVLEQKVNLARHRLNHLANNRYLQSPYERIHDAMQKVDIIEERLEGLLEKKISGRKSSLAALANRLDALSPLKILARGYAMVVDEETEVPLTSVEQIEIEDNLRLFMQDGIVHCEVIEMENKDYDRIR